MLLPLVNVFVYILDSSVTQSAPWPPGRRSSPDSVTDATWTQERTTEDNPARPPDDFVRKDPDWQSGEKWPPGFDKGHKSPGTSQGMPLGRPTMKGIPTSVVIFLATYGSTLTLGIVALTLIFTCVIMVMACCMCCRQIRRSGRYKVQRMHRMEMQATNGNMNSHT